MRPTKTSKQHGRCQLTGKLGPYVKAHILPEALTRPSQTGNPFLQHRPGSRAIRRWTSWYDNTIVTADGESILSDLDDRGIRELRRQRLIWSAWGPIQSMAIPGVSHSIRTIQNVDATTLRLFLLSILWRAAASKLSELADVKLPHDDLMLIRDMIRSRTIIPLTFHPISLVQLSTLGPRHNRSPFAEPLFRPDITSSDTSISNVIRFHFDGLVVYFHTDMQPGYNDLVAGPTFVGGSETIAVVSITFEASRQGSELHSAVADYIYNLNGKRVP